MRAVNLIPAEQRKGGAIGRRSQGVAFGVLGLLAGAAILVFMYGSASHQLASRKAEAAALTKQAQEVQAQAAQLSSYTSFIQMREQRLQAISQLVGSRFGWSAAMNELSRVLPPTISLSSLQGTIGSATGSASATKSAAAPAATSAASTASTASTTASATAAAPVTSATPPGTTPTFTLAGCATTQIAVAQMLVRLRLISGVSNVTLQSSARSGSSSAGGSSSSGGTCPGDDPSFTAQVSFQPLPTPPNSSVETLEASASGESSAGGSSSKSGPKAVSTSDRAKGAAG
jgi:Tfp pilus assembly protein PilN